MKNTITTLLSLLLTCSSLSAQEAHSNLEIQPLTEDCYVYTTFKDLGDYRFPSNSLYVVTGEGVVLIDTPWDTTQFQPLLDSIATRHGKPVVLCIATHYHDDRTASLEYFKKRGVATYTSRQTYDLCQQHHEKQAEYYFTKDTIFTVGGHQFETFYPGEGHTPDNIVVWIRNENVLFGGCLVKSTESKGLGNIADANLHQWPETIKNVQQKFPRAQFIIPGHFGWANPESLEHTLSLLKQNESSPK